MASTKTTKIEAEIEKTKAKISELQGKQKELEQKLIETENSEIVDIVRGMSISLDELPLLLQKLKSGQFVPISIFVAAGATHPEKCSCLARCPQFHCFRFQ